VTVINAPLTATQKKEEKLRQKKNYKSPSNSGEKTRVGISHRNRDRTTRHLETLSKL